MNNDIQPESPLARAARTGKFGGGKKQDQGVHQVEEVPPILPATQSNTRAKTTVYLSPDLLKWTKHQAVDQDKELSDIIEEALQQYRARHQTSASS